MGKPRRCVITFSLCRFVRNVHHIGCFTSRCVLLYDSFMRCWNWRAFISVMEQHGFETRAFEDSVHTVGCIHFDHVVGQGLS
jgi:hypothetical protein